MYFHFLFECIKANLHLTNIDMLYGNSLYKITPFFSLSNKVLFFFSRIFFLSTACFFQSPSVIFDSWSGTYSRRSYWRRWTHKRIWVLLRVAWSVSLTSVLFNLQSRPRSASWQVYAAIQGLFNPNGSWLSESSGVRYTLSHILSVSLRSSKALIYLVRSTDRLGVKTPERCQTPSKASLTRKSSY